MKKMLTSSKLAILWGRTFHVHLLSHATAQGRYMKTRRHLQNRKYITYRNAARGAVILSRAACMRKNLVLSYAMWFSSYVQASRQNISHLSRGQINSSFGVMPTAAESLMGVMLQVMLVRWNEPYQKLATCDVTGIIFVWIKHDGRWSIELINDRSSQVYSWQISAMQPCPTIDSLDSSCLATVATRAIQRDVLRDIMNINTILCLRTYCYIYSRACRTLTLKAWRLFCLSVTLVDCDHVLQR